MGGDHTVFGLNFADGRIKGYGTVDHMSGGDKTAFVLYVRGNTNYGVNNFVDNGDNTVTDLDTGLMWLQNDSGTGYNWEGALDLCESLNFAGYDDWRLPNAKELQSIVDYTRSAFTHGTPAIDPVFNSTAITDEGGDTNYPFYWTGTTHASSTADSGGWAAYLSFGEALGWMEQPPGSGNYVLMDVHGAGAQQSDPKSGDPDDYPNGHGPQGDVVRIYNYVRCVRGPGGVDLNPQYFSIIQNAYDASSDNDIIMIQALDFYEDVQCDQDVSIHLKGGYDADHISNPSYTTMNGTLTILDGKVIVENLVIQ